MGPWAGLISSGLFLTLLPLAATGGPLCRKFERFELNLSARDAVFAPGTNSFFSGPGVKAFFSGSVRTGGGGGGGGAFFSASTRPGVNAFFSGPGIAGAGAGVGGFFSNGGGADFSVGEKPVRVGEVSEGLSDTLAVRMLSFSGSGLADLCGPPVVLSLALPSRIRSFSSLGAL